MLAAWHRTGDKPRLTNIHDVIVPFSTTRGAELINSQLVQEVESQKMKEQEVLEAIKTKMERLKKRQDNLHKRQTLFDSDDHYVGKWSITLSYSNTCSKVKWA